MVNHPNRSRNSYRAHRSEGAIAFNQQQPSSSCPYTGTDKKCSDRAYITAETAWLDGWFSQRAIMRQPETAAQAFIVGGMTPFIEPKE